MTEPTAPNIPAGAPQEVKDFFDCRGNRLVWRSGEVTWLGLKVTPTVDFTQDRTTGALTIRVSILGGMVGFDLPASVNAAGELVVDTSSVPDLSEWGLGGRADIDAAIKRINDWFKNNGKKLKPATFANGAVTLEKTAIAPPPATGTAVTTPVPAPAPQPTAPKTVAPPPPPPASSSGGWCSLLGLLLLMSLFGAIALGAGIGYAFLGGPGPAAQGTATHTARPTGTPTPEPTTKPTPTAAPTVARTPTLGPSPSASPGSAVAGACARVVHQAVGDFISYLDWYVYMLEEDIDYLELVVEGANNDQPAALEFDSPSGAYYGILGLHGTGTKEIVSATLVLVDGTQIDLTDELADALGGKSFRVRFPQEDSFGNNCPAE